LASNPRPSGRVWLPALGSSVMFTFRRWAVRLPRCVRAPRSVSPVGNPMAITSYSKDGILTVCFTDARILDEATLEQLGNDLVALLGKTSEERMILDFRHVQFMSSSMLGKLVLVEKKCKEFKVKLKLCSIAADIRQVFKITRLDKLFDIEPDEEAARTAFMRRGWFG
jgi:anti-anti-sigma factor